MKRIKDAAPKIVTVGGGMMYTAVPTQILKENPQLDFALVGVFGDNEYPLWELLEELKRSPNDGSSLLLTPASMMVALTTPPMKLPNSAGALLVIRLNSSIASGEGV